MKPTRFSVVYNSFLSKITDDMYLELTEDDTMHILRQLLTSAIPKFEFPRQSMQYAYITEKEEDQDTGEQVIIDQYWAFTRPLNLEEVNILATYMIVQWLGQQLASVENTRMNYSGSDFKFTSQANHMQTLLQMKKDYEREGFHLQRLYKRRILDLNGVYHSTIPKIMEPMHGFPTDRDPNLPKPYEPTDIDGGGGSCDCDPLAWEDIQ